MKLSEYARRNDIKYRAAWNRFHAGKIPGAFVDESGHIRVPDPDVDKLPVAVVYARVSSHKQRGDLFRQAERLEQFAVANGFTIRDTVIEIASGVNDERPKLTKLLQDPHWGTLIVEHKDRLTRTGFNWFDVLLKEQGKQVVVVNQASEVKEDLLDDLTAILYSFMARLYGKRGATRRTQQALEAAENKGIK